MKCDFCGRVPKLGIEHPLKYHGPEQRKNSWHCDDVPECVKQCVECQDMVKAVCEVQGVKHENPHEAPAEKITETPESLKSAPGYAELMARLKGGS